MYKSVINIPINCPSPYETVYRPRHTPKAAVMRVSNVMNLVVEPGTSVIAARCSTAEPHRLPWKSL